MVIHGNETTLRVTLDEMAYHTKLVAKKKPASFLMTDMPFQTYATKEEAIKNAAELIRSGAEMVKIEGGAIFAVTVHFLTERGIPVSGHLGLLPQHVQRFAYSFEKQNEEALIKDAKILSEAGAQILILKCVHAEISKKIAEALTIPVIGIGSGPYVDGQIQILHDLLGFSGTLSALLSESYLLEESRSKRISYAKNFLNGQTKGVEGAIQDYVKAVKSRTFPSLEESFK